MPNCIVLLNCAVLDNKLQFTQTRLHVRRSLLLNMTCSAVGVQEGPQLGFQFRDVRTCMIATNQTNSVNDRYLGLMYHRTMIHAHTEPHTLSETSSPVCRMFETCTPLLLTRLAFSPHVFLHATQSKRIAKIVHTFLQNPVLEHDRILPDGC